MTHIRVMFNIARTCIVLGRPCHFLSLKYEEAPDIACIFDEAQEMAEKSQNKTKRTGPFLEN